MIQHVAIEVREEDAQACSRFWSLLGFERVDPPDALAQRAIWVQARGTQIHLLFSPAPVVPATGHIAVLVSDYDQTLAALSDAGFQPRPRTPYWDSPRAFVDSPGGHRVELMAFGPRGAP